MRTQGLNRHARGCITGHHDLRGVLRSEPLADGSAPVENELVRKGSVRAVPLISDITNSTFGTMAISAFRTDNPSRQESNIPIGGSQSFNAVNQMRILGRWMRMFTIPNQSSVAKAWQEFDENGRMKPSSWYDRIVDVAEELFKITLLLKGQADYLADRYSERKESHAELSSRVNQDKI